MQIVNGYVCFTTCDATAARKGHDRVILAMIRSRPPRSPLPAVQRAPRRPQIERRRIGEFPTRLAEQPVVPDGWLTASRRGRHLTTGAAWRP